MEKVVKNLFIMFLCASLHGCYLNEGEDEFEKNSFMSRVEVVHKVSLLEYKEGIKSFIKIDGADCNNALESNIKAQINYYVEFDTLGNIIKIVVYNDKYKYIQEGSEIKKENLNSDKIEKVGDYKLTCN